MRGQFLSFFLAASAMLCAPIAQAADFSDPTWPCVQRKVGRLSVGLMWQTPIAEKWSADANSQASAAELADTLALRRVDLNSIEPKIVEFADMHQGDADALGQVFELVFNRLSTRRTRIIDGIGKFSLSQIALAEKIDGMRMDMTAALGQDDFDKVDSIEAQLDWDQVIYSDRQQSITYLCETPTLLEKRLFSVAQMLQQQIRSE